MKRVSNIDAENLLLVDPLISDHEQERQRNHRSGNIICSERTPACGSRA